MDSLSRARPAGRLLSRRAAATYLGIDRGTVADLIADGAIRLTGNRIAVAELDRYIAEGPRPPQGRQRKAVGAPHAPGADIRGIKV